jgi:hypothetical protein
MKDLSLLTDIEDDSLALASMLSFDTVESFIDFEPYIKYINNPRVLKQLLNRMEEVHRNDTTVN